MAAWIVLGVWLCGLCSANSVEQKIYINLNMTAPCVRLMNATHQIGCQSSLTGDTGVIHLVQEESDLSWVLKDGPNPPYVVLLETDMFKRDIMLRLKVATRVTGVAVVIPDRPSMPQFSPDRTCPNDGYGLYSDSYGPEFAHCNRTLWNPEGNGLSYEDFPFPIFMLRDENETQIIRQCYDSHNKPVNGSAPDFPLCAMQLSAHMHGVKDTVTCMRRSLAQLRISLSPEVVCDPLGDYNIWGVTKPINNSKTAPPADRFVVAASRIDSRSFFWDVAPGAESGVSGFVALLAAAEALARNPEVRELRKNIMFVFFQGETFDYIGSSRMVYDMMKDKFHVGLQNIDSFIELNQVGIVNGSDIWAHTDPVSLRNTTIETQVESLLASLANATTGTSINIRQPDRSQPLPPSSFQRFLRHASIPGTVLTDHQASFANRYYQSVYDLRENIGLQYPNHLTPEEALNYVTDAARALAEVGTVVARALYLQAGGSGNLENIIADPQTVARMLYGFLMKSNNSWFRAIISQDLKSIVTAHEHLTYYVSANSQSASTILLQHVLANLTGSATNLTEEECRDADKRPAALRDLYSFTWIQGWEAENSTKPTAYCLQSSVRRAKAESPAFELQDWSSTEYSTWTESRWKGISARIFLVASKELEIITLVTGIVVLLVSLVLIYFVNAKANVLFTSPREHSTVTY